MLYTISLMALLAMLNGCKSPGESKEPPQTFVAKEESVFRDAGARGLEVTLRTTFHPRFYRMGFNAPHNGEEEYMVIVTDQNLLDLAEDQLNLPKGQARKFPYGTRLNMSQFRNRYGIFSYDSTNRQNLWPWIFEPGHYNLTDTSPELYDGRPSTYQEFNRFGPWLSYVKERFIPGADIKKIKGVITRKTGSEEFGGRDSLFASGQRILRIEFEVVDQQDTLQSFDIQLANRLGSDGFKTIATLQPKRQRGLVVYRYEQPADTPLKKRHLQFVRVKTNFTKEKFSGRTGADGDSCCYVFSGAVQVAVVDRFLE